MCCGPGEPAPEFLYGEVLWSLSRGLLPAALDFVPPHHASILKPCVFLYFFCSGGGDAAFKRNLSLKLEAQFLRNLACRAGILGGMSARQDASASSTGPAGGGAAGMEVVDDEDDIEGGVLEKGKGRVVPGRMGGAVPGHLMRRLQTLSLRMVEKYALLSQKDRGLACQGLCQLWLALSGPGHGDDLSRMVRVEGGVGLLSWCWSVTARSVGCLQIKEIKASCGVS